MGVVTVESMRLFFYHNSAEYVRVKNFHNFHPIVPVALGVG